VRFQFLFALTFLILRLSVTPGATDEMPNTKRSSSTLAITPDGTYLVAVSPDSNTLSIVDTASLSVVAELAVGTDPRSVAITPDGSTAYVANQGSNTLAEIDLAGRRVAKEIPVGNRPVGVTVSPNGALVAVAELGDDQVRFLQRSTLDLLCIVRVDDRPYGVVFTPDGKELLISHLLSGNVSVLSVRPFWRYIPVLIQAWDGAASIPARANITTSALATAQRLALIPTWPNVAPAPAVVLNGSGTRAYLPQTMANGQGLNTQFDTTVFPKVSVIGLDSWSHLPAEHISLPETDQPVGLPWDVATAKADSELWVVNAGSNDVSVLDISDPRLPRRIANIPVSHNPRGIVLGPEGSTAYVNNTLAGTVSVIDADTYTVTTVITVTNIPLPPLLLHGKRLFHSSARPELSKARWISCNTCHIEGELDGRTWLVPFTGELPLGARPVITRNTTSLLGMVQTYPLRWSAEWDESADSEFSVRFEQFGVGLIAGEMHPTLGAPNQGRSAELDALAAFIDGLPLPIRAHDLNPAERRGKVIFQAPETDCLTCHPPPLYTDLLAHDVGTADADGEWFGPSIDTPSLRFLYDSAPYLHDGSAATLRAVLTTKNQGDSHGRTSHLAETEISDLIAFLKALP
jgi:YVTN family beta-propeller protein